LWLTVHVVGVPPMDDSDPVQFRASQSVAKQIVRDSVLTAPIVVHTHTHTHTHNRFFPPL